ncbi:hypothetical protein D3C72_1463420 [compost metagenome]
MGHRRPGASRQGLAHADGMPGGRTRHFAALVQRGHGQDGRARHRCVCGRAAPVQHADRQVRRGAGSAGPHGRQPVPDGCGAHPGRARRRPGRKAGRHFRHRQIPRHGTGPRARQRRHGHSRRQGHLHRPQQFPRQRLPANPHRHHGRRGQHPHAQPDHLRPRRHPRASVCAQGNGRRQRKRRPQGLARFRCGLLWPCRLCAGQPGQGLVVRTGRRAPGGRARSRRARAGALLPHPDAVVDGVCRHDGYVDVRARWRTQAPRTAVRPAGRRAGATVPGLVRAETLRG